MDLKIVCRLVVPGFMVLLLMGIPNQTPTIAQSRDATEKLLAELTNEHGPSGFEGPVRDILRRGIPAINLGLPTRYAHSQSSVMDRADYDSLVKLVIQMIQKLSASEFRSIREF